MEGFGVRMVVGISRVCEIGPDEEGINAHDLPLQTGNSRNQL
jgi:hypothetical protein